MRRGKYLFAFIILIFTLSPTDAEAAPFSDVTRYQDEISYLTNQQIINGYPDGTFRPDSELNRLHGVRILLKVKGIHQLDAPNPGFTDMNPNSNGYAEVAKAVELGIISGKVNNDGSKYFDPNGKLTRGQMAKIIVKTMSFPVDHSYLFTDITRDNGYFNDISALAAAGVTTGYEDRTFRPNMTVTRQHFALFASRILNEAFKQQQQQTTYTMDTKMKYSWEYVDEGNSYQSIINYLGQYSGDTDIAWAMWRESGNGGTGEFLMREDEHGLYQGYMDSYFNVLLDYPLVVGKKYEDWASAETYTIISTNRVITTKAGTFRNVVEVTTPSGWKEYYAKNIGRIKSIDNGVPFAELINVEPNN